MLTWLLLHLAKNPKVQDQSRSEICSKRSELGLSPVSASYDLREQTEASLEASVSNHNLSRSSAHSEFQVDSQMRDFTFDELETVNNLDCVVKEALRVSGPSESLPFSSEEAWRVTNGTSSSLCSSHYLEGLLTPSR